MAGPLKFAWSAAAIGVVALGGVAWMWFGPQLSNGSVTLMPDDGRIVAQGAAIYKDACAQCHGVNLEGQPNWRERLPSGRLPAPPHDRTGHTWHHTDAQLFDLTKRGPAAIVGGNYQSDMPAYADILTDPEIIAVLSYIKSTWPATVRARHDALNRQADQ
ncbi:MAG: cytochrome c [Rhodospirillales bacterium]